MGIEKNTYSFRLDSGLVAELKQQAESQNRSFSNLVETILKTYILNNKAEKNQ